MAPTTKTIVKALMTPVVVPGLFLTLMGLGLVPVDEGVASVAAPFITPLNIPVRPFFCVLGPCKLLAGFALWKKGPMPEGVARVGLTIASACALYGHYAVGDNVVGPLVYLGFLASLYALDSAEKGKGD
ncbi:hypothetical protein ACHAXR_011245 [Thalassiosira sp. AJA248-18]